MRRTEHVVSMGESKNSYKSEGKNHLGFIRVDGRILKPFLKEKLVD